MPKLSVICFTLSIFIDSAISFSVIDLLVDLNKNKKSFDILSGMFNRFQVFCEFFGGVLRHTSVGTRRPGLCDFKFERLRTISQTQSRRMSSPSGKMDVLPWREAASLIIASRMSMHDIVAKGKNLAEVMDSAKWNYASKPSASDYRILMVKRSQLSSFMANAYVFPGGLVEPSDYSPDWWGVFECLGISREELCEFCKTVQGPRPPIVSNPITLKTRNVSFTEEPLPSNIALRISALRETFEETGILLLTNPVLETSPEATTFTVLAKNINIKVWQEKVHNDPSQFIHLCLQSGMCPDIWSLYEWSDWLTPTSVGHRRYDTIFYLCCLPRQPDVLLDDGEVTVMQWCAPEEMLECNTSNTVFLAPPQVYELSRLLPVKSYHELHNFARKRETKGCERWMPILTTATDGAISLLPGDDLYPEKPDLDGFVKPTDFSYSLEDLRLKTKNLHRLEIRGPQCQTQCNITPSCGHLQPLAYRPSQPVTMSYL